MSENDGSEPPVEYQALDLAGLCNDRAASIAGLTAPVGAPSPEMVPAVVGHQTFRGLPFLIGRPSASPGAPDLLILPGDHSTASPVSVPVGSRARWLIFVHRLLETRVYEGAPVGGLVAEYVVRYGDGTVERIPIREQFEMAFPDERLTQHPFLAWWDRDWELPPRLAGPWEETGARQTEAAFVGTPGWTLYPWPNPRPGDPMASVEVAPAGPRFALGGITLSHLEEHPFRAGAGRDVIVTMADAPDVGSVFGASGGRVTDAAAVADLAVSVDRGLAGFTFALPASSPQEFLADTAARFW